MNYKYKSTKPTLYFLQSDSNLNAEEPDVTRSQTDQVSASNKSDRGIEKDYLKL